MIDVEQLTGLSDKDKRVLRAIAKNDLPYTQRALAWVMVVCGSFMLLVELVKWAGQNGSDPLPLCVALVALFAGWVRLYEFRVRRMIKAVMMQGWLEAAAVGQEEAKSET